MMEIIKDKIIFDTHVYHNMYTFVIYITKYKIKLKISYD